MGGAANSEQRRNVELNLAVTLPVVTADGSPMVRKELIIALSKLVHSYEAACKEVSPAFLFSYSSAQLGFFWSCSRLR